MAASDPLPTTKIVIPGKFGDQPVIVNQDDVPRLLATHAIAVPSGTAAGGAKTPAGAKTGKSAGAAKSAKDGASTETPAADADAGASGATSETTVVTGDVPSAAV